VRGDRDDRFAVSRHEPWQAYWKMRVASQACSGAEAIRPDTVLRHSSAHRLRRP